MIFKLFTFSYVRMLCFIGGRVVSGCQHRKCHQHCCRASHSAGKGRGKWDDNAAMQTLALKIHSRHSKSMSVLQCWKSAKKHQLNLVVVNFPLLENKKITQDVVFDLNHILHIIILTMWLNLKPKCNHLFACQSLFLLTFDAWWVN